jgi:tetratricopeptide (TPR) repeat protein
VPPIAELSAMGSFITPFIYNPSVHPPNHNLEPTPRDRGLYRNSLNPRRPLHLLVSLASIILAQSYTGTAFAFSLQGDRPQHPVYSDELNNRVLTAERSVFASQSSVAILDVTLESSRLQASDNLVTMGLVSASAFNNRGIELMNQGNYTAAQTCFDRALDINPHYAPAYNNRAMIHILRGEEDAAIQDYTQSLMLNSRDVNVYFNRGLAYASADCTIEAIADYTQAISLNPRNAQAYHARGGAYLSLNNRAAARSDFQNAAALYLQQGDSQNYGELEEFMKQL